MVWRSIVPTPRSLSSCSAVLSASLQCWCPGQTGPVGKLKTQVISTHADNKYTCRQYVHNTCRQYVHMQTICTHADNKYTCRKCLVEVLVHMQTIKCLVEVFTHADTHINYTHNEKVS